MHFSEDTHTNVNRYVKKYSTPVIIKELKIKATIKYHLTHVRMAIIKKKEILSVDEDVEKKKSYTLLVVNIN